MKFQSDFPILFDITDKFLFYQILSVILESFLARPLLCKVLSNSAAIWYDIARKHEFRRAYTMTDVQQRAAARQFAADWKNRGDEKQET